MLLLAILLPVCCVAQHQTGCCKHLVENEVETEIEDDQNVVQSEQENQEQKTTTQKDNAMLQREFEVWRRKPSEKQIINRTRVMYLPQPPKAPISASAARAGIFP